MPFRSEREGTETLVGYVSTYSDASAVARDVATSLEASYEVYDREYLPISDRDVYRVTISVERI